jgi:O-antigen ligase
VKILAIYGIVIFLLLRQRSTLLLLWVAASPIISNLISIPKDNPFFGSYRIVDYVGYAAGPAKRFVELLDFDRAVLLVLFLAAWPSMRAPLDATVSRLNRWLGVLALSVLVSALYSHNVLNGLRKAVDTFGLCYIAFLIGRAYLSDPRVREQFVNAILLLGLILGVTCLIEYQKFGEWNLRTYGDAHRVTGPFRYWETLGITASLIGFVCWFKSVTTVNSGQRLRKAGFAALAVLMAYCVFRTQTRTIIFALVLGTLFLLYTASSVVLSKVTVRRLVMAALLTMVVLLVAPGFLTSTRFYRDTLNRTETEDSRKEAYTAATRMFLYNPLAGIGLKNFQDEMGNYMSAQEMIHSAPGISSCHSSYLVTAAECGLMGLVPLSLLIVSAFVMCRRLAAVSTLPSDKAWAATMLGMTLTFYLCGMTFDPFYDPTMQNQLFYMCLGGTAARMDQLINPA